MPGPNLTGRPNVDDLTIGRGVLMAALLPTSGIPGAWRDLGNAPDFSISTTIETKEHFSSREGLKVQDKQVVISDARGVKFSIEEPNHQNLSWFFSGETESVTNAAVAGFSSHVMVAAGTLEGGMYYDVKNASGVRAMDIDAADLTLTTTAGSPVSLVLGTDYEVNTEFGRIFFIATATKIITAVAAGHGINVTLAAKAEARTIDAVNALTRTAVEVALRFTMENAADGTKEEFTFWKVKLKAAGDLGLISEDWLAMAFEGACEKNTLASPLSPTLSIRSIPAA